MSAAKKISALLSLLAAPGVGALRSDLGECTDKVISGVVNSQGWDCSYYSPATCAMYRKYDTDRFKAEDMCCACGGGHRYNEVSADACAATCHGYTCDEWISNGEGNTCESLEDNNGCDCSGCDCKPPVVDPRNGFQQIGDGYCITLDSSPYHRDSSPHSCLYRCNAEPGCYAYSIDDFGCYLYYSPVSPGDGEFGAQGCFVKTSHIGKQPIQKVKDEFKPVSGHTQAQPTDSPVVEPNVEGQESLKPDNTNPLDPAVAGTEDLGGKGMELTYKPLGELYPNLAQVFLWFEKKNTFFQDRKFEPPSYCVDNDVQCPQLASNGYCTDANNGEWMKTTCRRSCEACTPEVPAPKDKAAAKFTKKLMSLTDAVKVDLLGKEFLLHKANINGFNKKTTWRVALSDDTILFSFQKGECKKGGATCPATWKIFLGRTSANKVLYFGVQRTSTFKFYRSEAGFEADPKDWSAEVRQVSSSKTQPASLQVTVNPQEDAGLLLLATYIVSITKDLVPDQGTSDAEN